MGWAPPARLGPYPYEDKIRALSGDPKTDRRVKLKFEGKGLCLHDETVFMKETSE